MVSLKKCIYLSPSPPGSIMKSEKQSFGLSYFELRKSENCDQQKMFKNLKVSVGVSSSLIGSQRLSALRRGITAQPAFFKLFVRINFFFSQIRISTLFSVTLLKLGVKCKVQAFRKY